MRYSKKIVISLSVIFLVVIAVSNFNLGAYEIPSGYGKIQFGMSKEQVKQILSDEKIAIVNEDNKVIVTIEELFDEKAYVQYSFTSITQKCMHIGIYFPNSESLQKRIRSALIEKYGKPYPRYVDGQSMPIWEFGSIEMGLLEAGDKLLLAYVDKNLTSIDKEEQNKLDKESKNKL